MPGGNYDEVERNSRRKKNRKKKKEKDLLHGCISSGGFQESHGKVVVFVWTHCE
jgi:hypothetical protein